MTLDIEIDRLTVDYGDGPAIDELSVRLAGGRIYGLLGRNGSGKTTLVSVLAAFRRPSAGAVRIDGAEPYENEAVTSRVCLIRETGDVYPTASVTQVLEMAARLRPDWDRGLAERLAKRFELPLGKRVSALSRGKRSALGVVLGLASRSPLTIFDESYLGMDAPSRYAFYDELLADYAEHPRTFVISSHLIEEVGSLFEEVLIIDRGRLLVHEEADALRSKGAAVTGPENAVDHFVAGMRILGTQRLGRTKSVAVYGGLDDSQRSRAAADGLELGPLGLQDLFVHLTSDMEDHA